MNGVDLKVFLHKEKKVAKINEDNEWLDALLSGDAIKEKKPKPEVRKFVSNSQIIAIRGN